MGFDLPGIWRLLPLYVEGDQHMTVNYPEYAGKLNIINVFQPGNPSGHMTPPVLWSPSVCPPGTFTPKGGLIHGTVGSNTLPYFTGGSVADGRMVCAHYLLPKDDYTVYKLVPDGKPCAHAGPSRWRGVTNLNNAFYGFELENLQDQVDPFTAGQYIKLALNWAYLAARDHIPDIMLTTHHAVCLPADRRYDPDAGNFSYSTFYGHLHEIRKPENWPTNWGLAQWSAP